MSLQFYTIKKKPHVYKKKKRRDKKWSGLSLDILWWLAAKSALRNDKILLEVGNITKDTDFNV